MNLNLSFGPRLLTKSLPHLPDFVNEFLTPDTRFTDRLHNHNYETPSSPRHWAYSLQFFVEEIRFFQSAKIITQ